MQHATSLDLGGAATILIEFGAIMLIGAAYKAFRRASDRRDEQDEQDYQVRHIEREWRHDR